MKKSVLFLAVLPMVILTGCSNNYSGYADPTVDMSVREVSTNNNISEFLNQARSAVVGISVSTNSGYSIGSGVSIAPNGYLLTNFHVVEGAKGITLYYADKTKGSAEFIWGDPSIDLAVLKSSRDIPYLATSFEDELAIGDEVYALGTPLTLQFKHTVTKGIISALDRTLESGSSYGSSFLQSLIQHDASINPGNSGGALINSSGKLIGINTLKATEGEGIGFAIPIEIGSLIVDQLSKDSNYSVPYLGVFGFDADIAQVYDESIEDRGVYVVSSVGPAKEVGIQKGDVITEVDGEQIRNILDLRLVLFSHKVGDVISLRYERDGLQNDVELTLESR